MSSIEKPGLQYPGHLDESDPVDSVLRNVIDNLFYLRKLAENPIAVPGAVGHIQQIVKNFNITTGSSSSSSSNAVVIVGTHAQRLTTYASISVIGTVYYEYDRNSFYILSNSTGVTQWTYVSGVMYDSLGAQPTDLGTADSGFIYVLTGVTGTEYIWSGAAFQTFGGYLQEISDAALNTITTVELIRHITSGVAAQGFGLGIVYQLEDSGGISQTAGYDTLAWENAPTTSSVRSWFLRVAGVLTALMGLESNGNLSVIGKYLWKSATNFFGTLSHANTANRTYTFADADGNIVYETAVLTNNNFLFGGGGALAKDAGFAVVPVANGGTGITYNRISDTIALTNQGAAIGSTNFANSSTVGTYRVSYYLEDTALDITAGTIQLTVAFTDGAGATTVNSTALALTALGRTSGVFFIQLTSGSIAYSTTLTGLIGTSKYALYICLERLS